MHKKTIEKIIESNDIMKMKQLTQKVVEMLDCMEKLDEEVYAKYELELYEIANGKKYQKILQLIGLNL